MNTEQRRRAYLESRKQQYFDGQYTCIPYPPSTGEWYHAVQYIDRHGRWHNDPPETVEKLAENCS